MIGGEFYARAVAQTVSAVFVAGVLVSVVSGLLIAGLVYLGFHIHWSWH